MIRPPPIPPLFPSTTLSRPPLRVAVSDRQPHVLARALRPEGGRRERSGHAEEQDLAPVARREDARRLGAGHARAVHHRSEEHTSELQSLAYLVCRLLLEKKK